MRERLGLEAELTKPRNNLASILMLRGKLEEAEAIYRWGLAQLYRHKPEGDWMRADAESLYGAYLAARGRFAEAETCLLAAYETLEKVRGRDILPTREARRRLTALGEMRDRPAAPGDARDDSP